MVLTSEDPRTIARRARLKYVSDETPGISRIRQGRGFRYEYSPGRPVHSSRQLKRIRQLAIPPAWSTVWICKNATGHLQATGYDEASRKQYLYHDRWHEAVNNAKFEHLLDFGKYLPYLRSKIQRSLRKTNPLPVRMLATLVRILDETGIRIGNESYAQENGSFGLTTLRGKHMKMQHNSVTFRFPGKSHQQQEVIIRDTQTVRFLKSLKRRPSIPIFGYSVSGEFHQVDAGEVNALLQELSGSDITAKDFRTWIASALMANLLASHPDVKKKREKRKVVKEATESVARFLGHTPAICRKYYLHPELANAYTRGKFPKILTSFRKRRSKWLRHEDRLLIHILEFTQQA